MASSSSVIVTFLVICLSFTYVLSAAAKVQNDVEGEGEGHSTLSPINLHDEMSSKKTVDISIRTLKTSNREECLHCQSTACEGSPQCCLPGHCPQLSCCGAVHSGAAEVQTDAAVEGEDHPMFMPVKVNEKMGSGKTLGVSKLHGNVKECLRCQLTNCDDPPLCCETGHCPQLFCCGGNESPPV